MGLCFYSSHSCLPTPSPVGGDGVEDSISDLDSLPEACVSSTRYFTRHNRIDHNPKAKHPERLFKWSTHRLHSIHQKAYEHWLWSSNCYWSHHDPSKRAPFRIKAHQVRAIVSSNAIGPKKAGIRPFVRKWTQRELMKRKRQCQQRLWQEVANGGLEDHGCIDVQLPFERERERSERRQQQKRPPSLERQDAFRDEETSKKCREIMKRYDSACGMREMRGEYEVDAKIRVVGYDQAMYEKQKYAAAVRCKMSWLKMMQILGAQEADLKSWCERELIRLHRNRLKVDTRRLRVRQRATCEREESTGQLLALDGNVESLAPEEKVAWPPQGFVE